MRERVDAVSNHTQTPWSTDGMLRPFSFDPNGSAATVAENVSPAPMPRDPAPRPVQRSVPATRWRCIQTNGIFRVEQSGDHLYLYSLANGREASPNDAIMADLKPDSTRAEV